VKPAAALLLVRRTRRRLEGLRLLRAGARGAALLAAGAIVVVLLGKAAGGGASWAWWLPLAGALGGLAVAISRHAIAPVSAALFLDARNGTQERFTTLWARPSSPNAPRWAEELVEARVPTLTWPREAGLVPVALFLLFAAGLIPTGSEPRESFAIVSESESAPAEEAAGDPEAAAKQLAEERPLGAEQSKAIERAIEAAFARPEERARARAALVKAKGGDLAASERLGKALVEGAGALGEPSASRPETANAADAEIDARLISPYPEEYQYLRAYRVERARLLRGER
jgi:hypothetical protein